MVIRGNMIAKFHKWTKLPINKGDPLCFEFNVSGRAVIRRPKKDDDHNCFAAEDIKQRSVVLSKVLSPVGIYLASNHYDDKKNDIKYLEYYKTRPVEFIQDFIKSEITQWQIDMIESLMTNKVE